MPYRELHEFQEQHPNLQYRPYINLADPMRLGTYTNHLPTRFREEILGKAKKAHPLGSIEI